MYPHEYTRNSLLSLASSMTEKNIFRERSVTFIPLIPHSLLYTRKIRYGESIERVAKGNLRTSSEIKKYDSLLFDRSADIVLFNNLRSLSPIFRWAPSLRNEYLTIRTFKKISDIFAYPYGLFMHYLVRDCSTCADDRLDLRMK